MAGRPAVESLLRAALAHVPSKGFTLASIRSAIPTASQWKPSNVDRALSVMFPGPDAASTSAPRRLFQTWDNHVTEELNEKFRHVTGLSNDEQAVQWLCDRLMKSDAVKSHLLLVSADALNPSAFVTNFQRVLFHTNQYFGFANGSDFCTESWSTDDARCENCRRSLLRD